MTEIGSQAFWGCTGITSLELGRGIKSLVGAFYGCTGLTSVTIPDSVTTLGDFDNCTELTSVTIPNSVTTLSSFNGCIGLTSVTIPDSVTTLSGFGECTGLTSVTIPDSVTMLSGFYGCTGLTGELFIPDSVTSIGTWAFWGCTGLTSVTIPDSVTSIGDWAFRDCTEITSINLPESVTEIGDYAFYRCSGFFERDLIIPSGVEKVGQYAFGVGTLNSLTINNSALSQIDGLAFYDCLIRDFRIGENLNKIDTPLLSGNTELTELVLGTNIDISSPYAFYGDENLTVKTYIAAKGVMDYCDSKAVAYEVLDAVLVKQSGSTGDTRVTLTNEVPVFRVTVPTILPVAVDSNNNVTVANNAAIVNYSNGAVDVTNAVLNTSTWSVVSFDTDFTSVPVNTKQYGFKINDTDVANGIDTSIFDTIDGQASLPFTYNANVAIQSAPYDSVDIGSIVFTVAWHK